MDNSNLSREDQWAVYKDIIQRLEFKLIDNGLTDKSKPFIIEFDTQFEQRYKIMKFEVTNGLQLNSGTLGAMNFFTETINNKSLRTLLAEQGLMPFDEKFIFNKNIRGVSGLFPFLGDMCSLLSFGGAYTDGSNLKERELVSTVQNFISDYLPKGYKEYDYYVTYEPWNMWFSRVACDVTYFLVNRNWKELNIICVTDSD
ncbi:hypothetical protein GCM10011506_01600 [Marivirga lumbricoides]|uniref:Uncharacterized protein n=1 Tax=Marivirga lumbricoides TaxID=1046115 RepID=A0ABQ1L901_9BACT|nr:hypothetical protein GCM10011506_01600 [Marivirga lumbricoides]